MASIVFRRRPMVAILLLLVAATLAVSSCGSRSQAPDPWGQTAGKGRDTIPGLDDIIVGGELIMATMSGPDTYYEYHGRGMGLHYMLLEEFCQQMGVALRVDICRDTAEMVKRVLGGEADVIAMPVTWNSDGLSECLSGVSDGKWHWLVNEANTSLGDEIDCVLTADIYKKVVDRQSLLMARMTVSRHVYSPMLDRAGGVISKYDHLFQRYAPLAGCDWRLMAAQCYQESCFDPKAHSWAGACGLMQIMPSTADQLGLPRSQMYDPEQNVAHAAKYIAQLAKSFADIDNPTERTKFVLASYNGGSFHVRDAMALARKNGKSPYLWSDVRHYILALQKAEYYNDPVVKNGYMRGSETADYVDRIMVRWAEYRGVKGAAASYKQGAAPGMPAPHPSARRKDKYNI